MQLRPHVIGHQKIQTQLERSLAVQNLHSALLFTGPEGIGKKLIAQNLAQTILCSEATASFGGCGQCQSCTVLQSGNHPDYIFADLSQKDEWKVENIREVLTSMHAKPYMRHGRVILFDNAHALSITAGNILLKTFEEPQEGNFFILVTSNPSRLPITLRSRCQVWGFAPLALSELRSIVQAQLPGEAFSEDNLKLSDGSVRNAQILIEQSELVSDVREMLRRLQQGDVSYFYEEVASWAKKKDEIPLMLHMSRLLTRDFMLTTSDLNQKAIWATVLEELNTAERAITERNLNPLLILFQAFSGLIPESKRTSVKARLANEASIGTLID